MGIYHKTTGVNELAQIELPIYGSGKIGNAYRQPDHLNFNYELTDHLGNVRATFSNVQFMATASMELNKEDHESQYFDNLHTRHIDPLMAYQSQYSARLFAGAPIGPSITTHVKAGAALKLEVKAKYLEPQGGFDPNILTSGIMGLITNNLNTGAIGEAGVLAGVVDNLNTELAATALVNTQNTNAPKAYLQYILFDDAYEVVDHGYTLVSDAANGAHETLTLTADIESDGYLYAYVVNESEIDVHFDNLTVSVLGLQVQSRTEYYPFGYVLSEYKHPDADLYRFGYQGQFAERDTVTQWSHFQLREYDARLARWLIVDPYRQHYSPYLAMGNNPLFLIDPNGGIDEPSDGGIRGFFNRLFGFASKHNIPIENVKETFQDADLEKITYVLNQVVVEATPERILEPRSAMTDFFLGRRTAVVDGVECEINHHGYYAGPRINYMTIELGRGSATNGLIKGINQLNKLVKTGKAPKTITRFDKGKIMGELDHVHFKDGAALNVNGTWKHGSKQLTNAEATFLQKYGWTLPD
jgi:RHS repeat-associated protein